MLPTLPFGPWQVSTYSLTARVALVIGGMWAFYRLLHLPQPRGIIVRGFFLSLLSGFAAAYLIPYLINRVQIARYGVLAHLEGMSIIWGILGVVIVALIYCRVYRVSVGRALDLAVLPVPLGLALGRLGCVAAGCCYGRPTASWLGVYLPDDQGVWLVRYPTQLLSVGANLLIFFILLAVEHYTLRRARPGHGWPFEGFLALLFFLLFSVKRLGMAFLRDSGTLPLWGSLSWMHVNALLGLGIALGLIVWNLERTRKEDRL